MYTGVWGFGVDGLEDSDFSGLTVFRRFWGHGLGFRIRISLGCGPGPVTVQK